MRMGIKNGLAQGLQLEIAHGTCQGQVGVSALDVLEPLEGVVGIKKLFGCAGGLHLKPQRCVEAQFPGEVCGKATLARAGFASKEQRLPQQKGHIASIP